MNASAQEEKKVRLFLLIIKVRYTTKGYDTIYVHELERQRWR
jgi:hypothetical protein